MKAVITVLGKDMVGILANVSTLCAKYQVNVIEVSQSIVDDLFAMFMMVEIGSCTIEFSELSDKLVETGEKMGLKIHVMHEDIFNSMHRI